MSLQSLALFLITDFTESTTTKEMKRSTMSVDEVSTALEPILIGHDLISLQKKFAAAKITPAILWNLNDDALEYAKLNPIEKQLYKTTRDRISNVESTAETSSKIYTNI